MRFKMLDGHQYQGRSYRAVVRDMAGSKIRTARSLRSYREATASRVLDAYGITIDTSDDAVFIQSLEKAGLMEQV
jgi:hypothetical protein